MRILALDIGDKRIGVALSDPIGFLASPLTTVERTSDKAAIQEILRLCTENDVQEIVVGVPRLMSGRIGQQARQTLDFVKALSVQTDIPIKQQDERLSSVEAERIMRNSGAEPSREKSRIDAVAAAVILQGYLDSAGQT